MQKFGIWIFCFLVTCQATAQSNTADSLRRLLSQKLSDTARVMRMVDLAWEINETSTDEAERQLQAAITLAQKNGFIKGEAAAWNGMGIVEEVRGNTAKALEHHHKALELRLKIGDMHSVAIQYSNLGNAYESAGQFEQALAAHRSGLNVAEGIRDTIRMARIHLNMGGVYEAMGSYPEAYEQVNLARLFFENRNDLQALAKTYPLLGHIRFELEMHKEARNWYIKALQLRQKLGEPQGIANAYSDLGNVLDEMNNQDSSRQALVYYNKALEIFKNLNDQPGIASIYNNFGVAYKHLGQYEEGMKYLRQALKIQTDLNDQPGLMVVYNSIGDIEFGRQNYHEALRYTKMCLDIAKEIGDSKFVQKAYKDFAKNYAALGDFAKAYEYRVLYDELRYKRLDEARAKDFERKEARFIDDRRKREIERQQNELVLRDAEIARSNTLRNALIGGAALLAILAGVMMNQNRLRARNNRLLASKNRAIERERERADSLLRNILPEKTANELKLHNTVQPVRYESVTVMFTDFKGFTKVAEIVPPEELIEELDECFRLFDRIVERYKLEKIKTIGDSYMCAGGLPEVNETHPEDTVSAAMEMLAELDALMQQKALEGKPAFEMRIGIHTGPVVAGIVGSHKFAYDIWGDTVNTAARLEQGSEVGQINISETTYQRIKHKFQCKFRGKLQAKNKGEIAMYYVER